jgi:hypothetical protein
MLMIAVILVGFYILHDWREEISYFFSSREPVDIGNVTSFPDRASEDPGWSPDLPHNRYIRLEGIPTRRALSRKYKFFKLIGGQIYIEVPRDDVVEDPLERIKQKDTVDKVSIDRTWFEGTGRLVSTARMSDRYQGFRSFYRERYNTIFCEELTPERRAELVEQRRDNIRKRWRERYEEADEPTRSSQNLTPKPTDEQLAAELDEDPVCVDAYLLQAETSPGDHWWYIAIAVLIVAFMLFNLYMLVRWLRRNFS